MDASCIQELETVCCVQVFGLPSITDYGVFYQKGFEVTIAVGSFSQQEFVSQDARTLSLDENDLCEVSCLVMKSPVDSEKLVSGRHKRHLRGHTARPSLLTGHSI